jgi:osmoprotectant transport system permease protein
MGMTRWEILSRVELPLGIPLLFTGIRIAAVTIVATAPIAALAGGGGLGDIIVNQASYELSVYVALVGAQAALTPRGLRRTSVEYDLTSRKEQL